MNPNAKLGFLQNNIVRGAVDIRIGGNENNGGRNKTGFNYDSVISNATVEVDGKPCLKDGRIIAI